MVNEPSLNGGRKLRPNVKNSAKETMNNPIVDPKTAFLWCKVHTKARSYTCFRFRATHGSRESFLSFFLSVSR